MLYLILLAIHALLSVTEYMQGNTDKAIYWFGIVIVTYAIWRMQ